jgi:hypothetical protein
MTPIAAGREPGFGLYVHWPFCRSKCPYCDFNSHVRAAVDHGRWRRALLRELEHYGAATKGRRLTSIFFGGGTPSLMEPETGCHRTGARHRQADPDIGITEANPTSMEGEVRHALRASVNRVSLGVQSLRGRSEIRRRQHGAGEARQAIELARRYFDRFTFSHRIRPGQSVAAWREGWKRWRSPAIILGLSVDHRAGDGCASRCAARSPCRMNRAAECRTAGGSSRPAPPTGSPTTQGEDRRNRPISPMAIMPASAQAPQAADA